VFVFRRGTTLAWSPLSILKGFATANRRRGKKTLAALILALLLAPGLVSFTQAGPKNGPPPSTPASGEKAALRGGTANVRLLGVNDFHGYLERPDPVNGRRAGGAAYLAAYLDRYARRPDHTVRVHAGDMVSASPLVSAYFHDEPTVLAMNEMGFDVGTLGNHEFDEGREEMLRLLEGGQRTEPGGRPAETSDPGFPGARFPYVAANTLYRRTGLPVLPPYEVVERDGVRIGFIGVTTLETPGIIIPDAAEDFRFPDISETVNRHASELRAQGVETIVVLAHSGALDTGRGGTMNEIVTETRQMSNGVDVVFSGHTHNRLDLRVAGKLVLQAEEYGTALGVVDLKVDRADGDVTGSRARVVTTYQDRVRPDPEVAALVERYGERVAPTSNRVLGTAAENIAPAPTEAGESALGDFVADGQRDLAGADFALVPTGGLRTDIARGPVTYGELFSVQPAGRDLVEMELSGEQVRHALEEQYGPDRDHLLAVSGLRYSYEPSRSPGRRVTALTLPNGDALDLTKEYSVAVNGFLAAGGGDFEVFTRGEDRRTVGTDIEALARHAQNLPQPFEAPDPAREPRVTLGG